TPALRLEVAIADSLVPELGHDIRVLAEEVRGEAIPVSGTPGPRDSSPADTVPRWLVVLEELVERVAPVWRERTAPAAPRHLGWEALELEAVKSELRVELGQALVAFGRALCQDPNLHASSLLLAEAAGWLLAADSTLGRVAWLTLQTGEEAEA